MLEQRAVAPRPDSGAREVLSGPALKPETKTEGPLYSATWGWTGTAVFVVGYLPFGSLIGSRPELLAVVPVVAWGWTRGSWVGLLAGFLAVPGATALLRAAALLESTFSFEVLLSGLILGPLGWISGRAGQSINKLQNSEQARLLAEGELATFRALLDKITDAIYVIDGDSGRLLDVNATACRAHRMSRKELVSRTVPEISVRARSPESWQQILLQLDQTGSLQVESIHIRSDGTTYPVEVAVTKQRIGGQDCLLALARNITTRVRERQLRRKFGELLLKSQDDERRRIAQELHDDTGQCLTSLIAQLALIENTTLTPAVATRVARARRLAEHTHRELGRLSLGLHPSTLDQFGLEVAIERMCHDMAKTHGFEVDVSVRGLGGGDARLNPRSELSLYRIVQEALTNVAKHAEASLVSVVVVKTESIIRMVVEDDGRGFSHRAVSQISGSDGLGLAGIRERSQVLNGWMTIESVVGQGTTVAVEIPVPG